MRLKKAISTLVLTFTISIAVLSVFTYILVETVRLNVTSNVGYRNVVRYISIHRTADLVILSNVSGIFLKNIGSRDISIEYLVALDSLDTITVGTPLMFNCNIDKGILKVEHACGPLLADYVYVAVVAKDGTVSYLETSKTSQRTLNVNATLLIPITFNVSSTQDLEDVFDVNQSLIAKPYTNRRDYTGIISPGAPLRLPLGQESELYGASVEASGLDFGVAVIGYDPSWMMERGSGIDSPPRFYIVISGVKNPGGKLKYNGKSVTFSENGYRVVIANFTGTIKVYRSSTLIACTSVWEGCPQNTLSALGVWYYGMDSNLNLMLELNGLAGYVANFMRISGGSTGQSSYYPYLFVGDIDGNMLPEILLITEDVFYGDRSITNDCAIFTGGSVYRCTLSSGNRIDLSDQSVVPLRLYLKQVGAGLAKYSSETLKLPYGEWYGYYNGSINGNKVAGIVLYLNVLLHDNSYPDTTQLEDIDRTDWVLRIVLVSNDGNEKIVREYRYQEICNLHKTYITDFRNDRYFVKISQTVFVDIPGPGLYKIAVDFQDPYGAGPQNDADITVGIEFIGAVPVPRE